MNSMEVAHDAYYAALWECADRYSRMICFSPHASGSSARAKELYELKNFIDWEFRDGIKKNLPLLKLNRWLGYIQGVLISNDVCTVENERNWTRPLFRPLDFPEEV